jgi:cytochrome P450
LVSETFIVSSDVKRIPPGPTEKYESNADLLTWLGEQIPKFGDIFRASIYGTDVYVINSPSHVRHVLLDEWENYPKGLAIKRIALLLGNGLMVSKGDFWKRQRRMIQPAFSRQALRPLAGLITTANADLLGRWEAAARENECVNLTRDISQMTLFIVLKSIFGDDYSVIAPAFKIVSEESARDFAFAHLFNSLGKHIIEVATERRAQGRRASDFLGLMMEARDRDTGVGMSDAQLAREIMTLIVAGHETTASSLNWTWRLLSENPAVEVKLWQELDRVGSVAPPTVDELNQFPYTRNVIEEALRLYPPGWLMTRRALREDWIGEYYVPPGTEIYISPYYIQRHPTLWESPEAFDPDRHDPSASIARPALAMLPFSVGPRNCVGETLARWEMQIHLIMVASRLQLRRTSAAEPVLAAGVNLLSAVDFIMNPRLRHVSPSIC